MAEAKNATEALKTQERLRSASTRLGSAHEYETILREEIARCELFWKISPHPEITDLFFLSDVLNLKILSKANTYSRKLTIF